jgi:hypothetical protein
VHVLAVARLYSPRIERRLSENREPSRVTASPEHFASFFFCSELFFHLLQTHSQPATWNVAFALLRSAFISILFLFM